MSRQQGGEPRASVESAQRRADRIQAFRLELEELERDGILHLTGADRDRLRSHHDSLLAALANAYDVDRTEVEKRLSVGMRIASFLGAIALSAAAYFLFDRIWGLLSAPVQVAFVAAAPLVALAAAEVAARRDRPLYFAGLVAVASFVLNLSALETLFNIAWSPSRLAAWSAFAWVLAYAYGLRVLLAVAIVFFMVFLAEAVSRLCGYGWEAFFYRPENFVAAGVILFALPSAVPHRKLESFPPIYRIFGALAVYGSVLVLAFSGQYSSMPLRIDTVETGYQLAGFALGGLGIWMGIRQGRAEVTNVSSVFAVTLLYLKFFDWWWDWMPKWLFFLVLGGAAVGLLVLLRRVRGTLRGARA